MTRHVIVSREVARMGGLGKYYTARPCRRGHDSLRYVASGQCVACCDNRRRGTLGYGKTDLSNIHPDDVPAVRQFIDALAYARSL